MNADDFVELNEPEQNPYGWYVASTTQEELGYLHADLLMHSGTDGPDPDVFPGYFISFAEAELVRDAYYSKHNKKTHNHNTAYDAAMAGI